MNDNRYIVLNGLFHRSTEKVLTLENRSFKYGDGLFESIYCTGNRIHYFDDHIDRIVHGMQILKMQVPTLFTASRNDLEAEISRLLVRNKLFKSARVRLTVFRSDGGLYTPVTNQVNYAIETEVLSNTNYELNEKPYKIDIYTELSKQSNFLSNLKSANALFYIMAAQYAKSNNFDDVLLINNQGKIIETISSNVFLFADNKLITPSISDGCVAGIMRKQIIRIAKADGFDVIDDKSVHAEMFLTADEVFTTNAIKGIAWIGAFRTRRYFHKISERLIKLLNIDANQNLL
jgi:branched-subunit amino acid aminotransferase/4-amino-4-deoxychorismate lyase